MGKRFIISETEKNDILRMYDLITEQVSKRITIQGLQPAVNTDWDLVHGILGSKRLNDDLEQRVGDELKNGNYRVTKVYVTSKKVGNQIVTDGAVDLSEVKNNQLPHKVFTTRGSIGSNYEQRHDSQVSGLEDRLKNQYKGEVTVFGPYEIDVEGTNVKYRQTFYAIESQTSGTVSTQNQQKVFTISGTGFDDIRNKLKSQKYPQNIDVGSILFDPKTYTVTYNQGSTPITSMSMIFDDSGQLNQRLGTPNDKNAAPNSPQSQTIFGKNKNMFAPTNLKGKSGSVEWQLVYFS